MTEAYEWPVLRRVLVGSHAHGLAGPDSDYDYREMFAVPTSEILSLGRKPLKYAWQSPGGRYQDDEGGYEIANFIHLCSKGSPNAIEMLCGPQDDDYRTDAGDALVALAPLMLARKPVVEGVIGYARNAWAKLDSRPRKWQVGMLRSLGWGRDLIENGPVGLTLEVPQERWGETVRAAFEGEFTDGEAMDIGQRWINDIRETSEPTSVLRNEPDWSRLNDWLLEFRRSNWTAT